MKLFPTGRAEVAPRGEEEGGGILRRLRANTGDKAAARKTFGTMKDNETVKRTGKSVPNPHHQ